MKIVCKVSVWLLMLLGSSQLTAQDITSGLIAHYPFDGNTDDASGNGFDGTLSGTISYGEDRYNDGMERSIYFSNNDNSGQGSKFMRVTHDPLMNSAAYTVSFWYRQNWSGNFNSGTIVRKGNTNEHYDIRYGNATAGDIHELIYITASESITSSKGDFRDTAGWLVNGNVARGYDPNAWFLLTMTYENNVLKAYLDGQLLEEKTLTTSPTFNEDDLLVGLGLNIFLDDLRIYNRALTENDIQALHEGDLLADFSVNQQSGDLTTTFEFTDLSTASGTITSQEWFLDTDAESDAMGSAPTFTYDTPGTYSVTLRITDDAGRTASVTKPFLISVAKAPFLAREIVSAEYFFDEDPGLGSGNAIDITSSGTEVTGSLEVATDGLTPGFHTLHLRTATDNGQWGMPEARLIYIQETRSPAVPATAVVAAEYFFDNDPGVGKGTAINVANSAEQINQEISVGTAGLATGFHRLFVRTRDDKGIWSLDQGRLFFVNPATPSVSGGATVAGAEYFFDTDPGVGNGTAISLSAAADVEEVINITDGAANSGFHTLYLRVRDENQQWSAAEARNYYVQRTPDDQVMATAITDAEFFFDTVDSPVVFYPDKQLVQPFVKTSTIDVDRFFDLSLRIGNVD
ncbi:MAG: LamG-like jellyroll fold domain-containing protein, partial [Bacteroidota bacterium]